MSWIEIKNIRKEFKQNVVLKNIDLLIEKGELIYIKGKNGCGKSTLLKIIAGLIEADKGYITYPENVNIGGMIENPSFIESETAYTNLKYLYNLKNKFNKQKVEALMQAYDLDLYSKVKVKDYSIGMKQKLGIIQAIMEDQNFILLDEPIRGLDVDSIKVFIENIKELHRNGKTIIICSHDGVEEIEFTHTYEIKNGICEKLK